MTAKQKRFVAEYLKDGNGAGAAVRAGYSDNGAHVAASRMLSNVNIRTAVVAGQREAHTEAIATRTEALEILTEITRTSKTESTRIKAMETLARLEGWDAPRRIEADVRTEPKRDLSRLTVEELRIMADLEDKITGDAPQEAAACGE